jgi:hypothetical protein
MSTGVSHRHAKTSKIISQCKLVNKPFQHPAQTVSAFCWTGSVPLHIVDPSKVVLKYLLFVGLIEMVADEVSYPIARYCRPVRLFSDLSCMRANAR